MIYLLSEEKARLLDSLLRREAGRVAGLSPVNNAPAQSGANWQLVRVTGDAVEDAYNSGFYPGADYSGEKDYYPAVVELWGAKEEEATDIGEAWLIDRNGDELTAGRVYMARQTGERDVNGDIRAVFVTVATATPFAGLPDVDEYNGYGDQYYGDGCEITTEIVLQTSTVTDAGDCIVTTTTIDLPFPVRVCSRQEPS